MRFVVALTLIVMTVAFRSVALAVVSPAVLIDAVVVRIVILPALMTLLGPASWWPSKLGRRGRDRAVLSDPEDGLPSARRELVRQV